MKGTLKLRTASLAAAAVMAAGLFAALPAAAETSTPETAQEDSGVPYDVANGLENSFRYKDGVPIYDDSVPAIEWEDIVQQDAATYSSNGIATCSVTYNGFDVSYHQGTVDWDAVKNSGIDFVMIRCGIGSEYDGVGENKQDDAQWYRNVSECERLGIPYGVYLYSYAENTDMAASEARHTLSLLSGHNPTLPVFLDIEHTRNGNPIASNSTYGDIAQTWCNMVSNAGYRVGIYSYYYFFQNYLTDSRFSNSGWYKWMADYRSGVSYDGSSCNMWQYSNKGTVPGVNANVDLNYWFGEYPGNNGGNNNNYTGWRSENGRDYWYENGVKQGTTGRGKEIYDSGSNAWYWLDANQGGAKAVNKDVYQESNGGKWVRYDANGHMVKGWDTNEKGTYYFDLVTGAMVKGMCTIDGIPCAFDTTTGIGLDKQWVNINGDKFWYEGGKRQGTTGRGKEIYDPASDAWYWLDSVNNGAMAVSKDVYQDSNGGKWVRYDANGHMIKGWNTNSQGTYYFDLITGAMAKGTVVIDGITCVFDYNTGILQSTNVDVTKYREIKRTNYYADGSVMNTLTTDYDAQGRLLKEQRRDKSGNLQVQDDFYYEYNGMLTKHTHREYGNDNYSYEYRYEYDKSNRFAKISVYRYNGGWYLYSYWTAKEWDSLGSVSKFWEYNGQNKVTCIVNLTSSGSRNRYTKMTIVNSSNKTVRTDTWSYDSNGHLAGWTNSGNSNGYSNVLRLSSDNNIGAGNPLFDRHCGKFVTDDKITSASIKFQNDEVVEIRQNNQRISYTNQESMGMNSSNNLTRTFATYTDGGNFRYRTLVEYFKYKN